MTGCNASTRVETRVVSGWWSGCGGIGDVELPGLPRMEVEFFVTAAIEQVSHNDKLRISSVDIVTHLSASPLSSDHLSMMKIDLTYIPGEVDAPGVEREDVETRRYVITVFPSISEEQWNRRKWLSSSMPRLTFVLSLTASGDLVLKPVGGSEVFISHWKTYNELGRATVKRLRIGAETVSYAVDAP